MGDDADPDPTWPDPTVHVPYRLRIETASGDTEVLLAHFVAVSSVAILAFDPDGHCVARLSARDVRSIEVLPRELPADYDELRAEHPHAYEPWRNHETELRNLAQRPGSLGELARRTGRPVAHVLSKAAAHGIDVSGTDPSAPEKKRSQPRRQADDLARSTALHAERDHVVFVRPGIADPIELLVRHNIPSYLTEIYRMSVWGFAARLHGRKADRLAADPDVERVEPDEHRRAPVLGQEHPDRIPGSYIVDVRLGVDSLMVAARNGVVPDDDGRVSGRFFGATLSDDEVERLRRDPDVMFLECATPITITDGFPPA